MTALNEIESGVDTQPNPPPKFIETVGKSTFFNFFWFLKCALKWVTFAVYFTLGSLFWHPYFGSSKYDPSMGSYIRALKNFFLLLTLKIGEFIWSFKISKFKNQHGKGPLLLLAVNLLYFEPLTSLKSKNE